MKGRGPWWALAMLRAHPPGFRARYGAAVQEVLAARAAEVAGGGSVARLRFVLREGTGLLASVAREWLRAARISWTGEGWGRTLRLAGRRLRRAPGFSIAAIGMLALGVGSTMAVYTLLHRVVLRPLPYEDADRLVWLDHRAPGLGLDDPVGMTAWLYAHYRESSRLLEGIALAQSSAVTLIPEAGPAERLTRAVATASAARVLGVSPLLGRWFEGDVDARSVVLSEGVWRGRFGGDPNVLGRAVRLGDARYEVVGVMPERFAFPNETVQLWTSAEFPITYPDRGFNYVAVGRMVEGATLAALGAELQALVAVAGAVPGAPSGVGGMVERFRVRADPVSLKDRVVGNLRATLWLLLGAVVVLLVTAWANVANLFLVRAEARQREVAVRRALGAGGLAIARFFVAEGVAIGAAAGAAGLALAWVLVRFVAGLATLDLPRASEIAIDPHVVVVALGLSLVSGSALALLPLLRRSGDAAAELREGGRAATAGRARLRIRAALMAGQVALAMTLLAAAGLLLRSWSNVRELDPGFAAGDVLFVELAVSRGTYPTRAAQSALFEDIAGRVAALPRIDAVGLATCPPLDGYCWGESVTTEGVVRPGDEAVPIVSMRRVSAGYFDALRLPITAGRAFSAEDRATRADVVVLSREAARRLFPDRDPVGLRVAPGDGGDDAQWFTVIGVAADVATSSVLEATPDAVFYLPLRDSRDDARTVTIDQVTLLVSGSADPAALVPALRGIVQAVDPTLAPARIRTLDQVLSEDRATLSFTTLLLVIAGTMGLLLSALGVYAVFAYVIGRRTPEFGLRLALGARATDISRIVFRQAGAVLLVGVASGLVAALLSTRLLESLLFGVDPVDPVIFGAATLVLTAVAVLAAAIPTRRAWRLRPVEALRSE